MVHSLKTKKSVPATFFISRGLGCNIISESLVYELGYIPESAFKESFLCTYSGGDEDESQGQLMFGTEHIASASVQNHRITKGNVNSRGKRHQSEKLKDHCANTQKLDKFGNMTCA